MYFREKPTSLTSALSTIASISLLGTRKPLTTIRISIVDSRTRFARATQRCTPRADDANGSGQGQLAAFSRARVIRRVDYGDLSLGRIEMLHVEGE